MKVGTQNNSSMLNSMMIFICLALANLVIKIKILYFFIMVCVIHKMKRVQKRLIQEMSNLRVLHYKLKEIFKTIHLIANIYQYKVDNIILLNTTLYMLPKSKMFMFNFPGFILNNIKTLSKVRKTSFSQFQFFRNI